jgi:hypothetical protein
MKYALSARTWCFYAVLVATVLASSCRKDLTAIKPADQYAGTDLSQVFDAFWSGMNTNYVFWSIDTVDWDAKYKYYKPLFARLNINNTADVLRAFQLFSEMDSGLVDSHLRISFTNPVLADTAFSPAVARKKNISPYLPFTYFSKVIGPKYFDSYYWADTPVVTSIADKKDTANMGLMTGVIQKHILYLHITQFFLRHVIVDQHSAIISKGWDLFLSNLHTGAAVNGVIIDLRSNTGGLSEDMNFITGQFITQPMILGYTREKNGNGRLDYTPWANAIVTPDPGAKALASPIVVLTDQRTVSMAEHTTMALKRIPGTYIIGDTTWGANGLLNTNDGLYGGGQFSFANFGYCYTSSVQFKCWDGKIYEGKGFPPDKYVPYNKDSVNAGTDVQLTAAIHYLEQ